MVKLPIRAIFLIKDPHRSPDVPHRRQPFEFIAALRARPGIASLSNARRALAGRFSICLAHDSSEDGSDSMLGVRVLHFELRALSPGADAPRACQDALDSMRLSPKGLGRCLPIPPPDGTGPELDFGERPALEALDSWRRRAILASCAAWEAEALDPAPGLVHPGARPRHAL